MKIKIVYLVFLLFNVIFGQIFGQISTNEEPFSFANKYYLSESQEISIIKQYDIDTALSLENTNSEKYQFGNSIDVSLNLSNSGIWRTLPNGDRIWTLVIKCDKAKSIGLIYDKYWLPPGAKLFLYNKETLSKRGAFTNINNSGSMESPSGFATSHLAGSKIYIELLEPRNVFGRSRLSIDHISYALKCSPVFDKGCYGWAGSCHVNVNCTPEGNGFWQFVKKGVAAVTLNNGRCWLTGTLLTNTLYDGTPYFYTAEHGLHGSGGVTNIGDTARWLFYWDWESKTCANSANFDPPSTYGAVLVAKDTRGDFALLRLIEMPQSLDPYDMWWYNGWDRDEQSSNEGGVMIHHPQGDMKKIATYKTRFNSLLTWYIPKFLSTVNGYSIPEGGSSGAPIFNEQYKVIGNHSQSEPDNCFNPSKEISIAGSFASEFDLSGLPSNRLRPWLAPNFPTGGPQAIKGDFLYSCGRGLYIFNTPINTNRTEFACVIRVNNSVLSAGNKLTLNAKKYTLLEENFEVINGAELEIKQW
jgi:lysyl endopeptidase